MDSGTLGNLVALFAFALPCSVFCIAIALIGSGHSDEAYELPLLFRLAATAGFLPANRVARLLVAAAGLVLFNAGQAITLATRRHTAMVNLTIAYFIVLVFAAVVIVVSAVRIGAYRTDADGEGMGEVAMGTQLAHRARAGRRQSSARAHEPGAGSLTARSDPPSDSEAGMPCVVHPVEWPAAGASAIGFNRQLVADSYQEALVLGLAMAGFDPKYPRFSSARTGPVVRSRMVRATPGNKLLRWLLPYVAGTAVCEVETEVLDAGAPSLHKRAVGKRRWAYFGGDSEILLIDAARLAGEHAAQEIAGTLGS